MTQPQQTKHIPRPTVEALHGHLVARCITGKHGPKSEVGRLRDMVAARLKQRGDDVTIRAGLVDWDEMAITCFRARDPDTMGVILSARMDREPERPVDPAIAAEAARIRAIPPEKLDVRGDVYAEPPEEFKPFVEAVKVEDAKRAKVKSNSLFGD